MNLMLCNVVLLCALATLADAETANDETREPYEDGFFFPTNKTNQSSIYQETDVIQMHM